MDVNLGGYFVSNLYKWDDIYSDIEGGTLRVNFSDMGDYDFTIGHNAFFAISVPGGEDDSKLIIVLGFYLSEGDDSIVGDTVNTITLDPNYPLIIQLVDVNTSIESVPNWFTYVIEITPDEFQGGGGES